MVPKHQKRLNQFHDEMQETEARVRMAINTLQGAQRDYESRRIRFEAAVEFVGGAGATWTHNPEDGVVVTEAAPAEQNGAGEQTPRHNRETRRAAGKALGK